MSGSPVSVASRAMTRAANVLGRVDAGADGGAAERQLADARQRGLQPLDRRARSAWRSRRTPGRGSPAWRPSGGCGPTSRRSLNSALLAAQRLGQVLERRHQVDDDAPGRGHVDGRREHVVRRLRRVDVVVRVHRAARAARTPAWRCTSFTFMFDEVPEPVWNTSTGNWSSHVARRPPRRRPSAMASATSAVEHLQAGVDRRPPRP